MGVDGGLFLREVPVLAEDISATRDLLVFRVIFRVILGSRNFGRDEIGYSIELG